MTTGCLTGWLLVEFAAAQIRLKLILGSIGAVARLLAGFGAAMLCTFWAPIFVRFSALREQREIDPVVVYEVAFVDVAWMAQRQLFTARRHPTKQDNLK